MTKHVSAKRSKVPALTAETRRAYLEEEKKYFLSHGDSKRPGLSASDQAMADRHLPPAEAEHKLLEYYTNGYSKTARSGAFSKPNVGPAIFPNGRKGETGLSAAMSFIDRECTPGHYKQSQSRPVPREQTKHVDVKPAACTLVHFCIDCMELIDSNNASQIRINPIYVCTENIALLIACGVDYGDVVICAEHVECRNKATNEMKNDSPLISLPIILVREGELTPPEEMAYAAKHGRIERMHDGHEFTVGQYYQYKRQERMYDQLFDYLVCLPKDSTHYHRNRVAGVDF